MTIQGNYLGMPLEVSDLDIENVEYFRHCAAHNYPPATLRRLQPRSLSAHDRLPVVREPQLELGVSGS